MSLESVKPFIGTHHSKVFNDQADAYILGFPFDGSTSFRPGTRFGPNAIRENSDVLEDYSPYLDLDLSDFQIVDLGNLELYPSRFETMKKNFESLPLKKEDKLLTLGGEHSISYCPMSFYLKHFEDLLILHFDAHTDLRDGYLDDPYSHASVIYRTVEKFGKHHELLQYGIRSGTKEEFQWMKQKKTLITNFDQLLEKLHSIPTDRPLYMTLDLDFFDPSELPGTGTPEAGGVHFNEYIKIVKILKNKNLRGLDIVELSPPIDSSGNSSIFAAKVVRESLLGLVHS